MQIDNEEKEEKKKKYKTNNMTTNKYDFTLPSHRQLVRHDRARVSDVELCHGGAVAARQEALEAVVGKYGVLRNRTNAMYLPEDDRRHFVAWSEACAEDFPADYWPKLWQWLEAGGAGHVVAYLRAVDLSEFDPKAPPEKTPAFWLLAEASETKAVFGDSARLLCNL